MPALLFLAFLAVPLAELWLILQVGEVIGGWWTLLLLVADSVVGAFIVRREGRRAWQAFRQALADGRWPGDEVAQGGLVLVGGALLLTPGFLTDVVGLLLVLPPTRALAARFIRTRLTPGPVRVVDVTLDQASRRRQRDAGARADDPETPREDGDVLDVEVVSIEPDEDEP